MIANINFRNAAAAIKDVEGMTSERSYFSYTNPRRPDLYPVGKITRNVWNYWLQDAGNDQTNIVAIGTRALSNEQIAAINAAVDEFKNNAKS